MTAALATGSATAATRGMSSLRVLDLFSGIGAFSLGLERAGMRTVAFCEVDPFCRRVLAKHWPEVPQYDDVRMLTAERLRGDGISVDLICGGFPCQDISVAGRGAGLAGERSGLWSEFARLIGEIRPRYAIVENVAALLGRGLGDVLGDLAALGYDAEWHCIPASAIGAPHQRDRVWIMAYAHCAERWPERFPCDGLAQRADGVFGRGEESPGRSGAGGETLAHSDSGYSQRGRGAVQMGRLQIAREIADYGDAGGTQWGAEPDVGRVAHGVASRVDRLRGLGNALVPQIPELIGHAILAAETRVVA